MVNRYVMKSEHDLFIDCLPYEWRSGTSDGLFLPIYPPRSMRVMHWFWRRSREERIEAMHTRGFTQLRAARMRKTLLLLCGFYCVLGSAECYSTLRQLIRPSVGGLPPFLPLPLPRWAWGLLLYVQGVTHRWQRRRG